MWWARRIIFSTIAMLGIVGPAVAKEDPRRAMIQAATQDAVAALSRDVLSTPISSGLNVAEFVDQFQGRESLDAALQTAHQVGGARWIGDETCMVRVELNGDTVAAALADIVKTRSKESPEPPAAFQKDLSRWTGRTFAAEGSSTGANAAKDLRPSDDNGPWRSVAAAARRDAVATARAGAVERVLNGLENVSVVGDKTVGDALEVPTVRTTIREWLSTRPVTDVHFHPDLNVELTIAAPGEDLWQVFRPALEAQTQIPKPGSEADWVRLHADVVRHVVPGVGRAQASGTAASAVPGTATIAIPQRAPRWVNDSVDAVGSAKKADGKLITKKHAEDDAYRDLRRQIEKLPLSEGHTLGDAAKTDRAIDSAIERSLLRARAYKVDYRADGGVDVRYHLDLTMLWHEISSR